MAVAKVTSGGQTGVDQAALQAAQAVGLACGGWCPPGRACDDGVIPARFPLQDTPQECSPAAPHVPRSQRTEWNVRDADATLLLIPAGANRQDPGTDWTIRCARTLNKPLLVCDPADSQAAGKIVTWLRSTPIATLNVAGPSERTLPGIGEITESLLLAVFRSVAEKA